MKKKSRRIENIRKINSKKNWKIESNRISDLRSILAEIEKIFTG